MNLFKLNKGVLLVLPPVFAVGPLTLVLIGRGKTFDDRGLLTLFVLTSCAAGLAFLLGAVSIGRARQLGGHGILRSDVLKWSLVAMYAVVGMFGLWIGLAVWGLMNTCWVCV